MHKIAAGMQKKRWQIQPESADVATLAASLKVSALTAQILINRDLYKEDAARSFLSPKLTDLIEPERMYGISAAAEHIKQAIENGQKISIYGDYDVDGITSTAILWHLLKMLGAQIDYYIPHRVDEGYGLNAEAVRQLANWAWRSLSPITTNPLTPCRRPKRLCIRDWMRTMATRTRRVRWWPLSWHGRLRIVTKTTTSCRRN
jgi:hypothetical protein